MARAALSASQGRQPGRNKQPVLLGTESLDIIIKEEKPTSTKISATFTTHKFIKTITLLSGLPYNTKIELIEFGNIK